MFVHDVGSLVACKPSSLCDVSRDKAHPFQWSIFVFVLQLSRHFSQLSIPLIFCLL